MAFVTFPATSRSVLVAALIGASNVSGGSVCWAQDDARQGGSNDGHKQLVTLHFDLRPVNNLRPIFSGKEIFTELPTLVNGRVTWQPWRIMYFAADGTSFGLDWYLTPWTTHNDKLCMIDGTPRNCYSVVRDADTGQFWLEDSSQHAARIAHFDDGDTANIKGQFADAQHKKQRIGQAINGMAELALRAFQSAGDGEAPCDSECKYHNEQDQVMREREREEFNPPPN